MKNFKKILLALGLNNIMVAALFAQGTAFTYQGQLSSGTNPANGSYDVQFTLFSLSSGGSAVAGPLVKSGVGVTNGLFTTTVDFGGAFNGATNWLELEVRTNGGSFSTPLTPRQQLTPTPYAVYAETANATNLVGTVSGAQIAPGSIGAVQLSNNVSLWNRSGSNIFYSAGNVGVGTGSPDRPLAILGGGGSAGNGEWISLKDTNGVTRWHLNNFGGGLNVAQSGVADGRLFLSTNGNLGIGTTAPAQSLDVAGSGLFDWVNNFGTVYLGDNNHGIKSTINEGVTLFTYGVSTGLFLQQVTGNVGIGIGATNPATTLQVGGTVTATSFVGNGAGLTNVTASSLPGVTIQQNSFGGPNVILGSPGNSVANGVVGGTVGGGGSTSYFGFPVDNSVTAIFGTVGGGAGNTVSGFFSTVPGGNGNTASGANAFAAGYSANATNDGAFVWADFEIGPVFSSTNNNSFNVRAQGGARFVTSGAGLSVDGPVSATVLQVVGTVNATGFSGNGGGVTNVTVSGAKVVSVGNGNVSSDNGTSSFNFFVGPAGYAATTGDGNTAIGLAALSACSNADFNTACGYGALNVESTGLYNAANGGFALGANTSGIYNTADGGQSLQFNGNGNYNTSVGGQALQYNENGSDNTAIGGEALRNSTGAGNIALGYQAGQNLTSGDNNIYIGNAGTGPGFSAGESDIIRIGDSTIYSATYLAGTVYANGVALTSDRNAKENFQPVDTQAVLSRVASLPLTEWNYKTDREAVRHIGPMAQDFQAAFELDGADDKHISVVDEGGVALAAIQGLSQKLDEKDEEIKQQQQEIDELKAAVKSLLAKK